MPSTQSLYIAKMCPQCGCHKNTRGCHAKVIQTLQVSIFAHIHDPKKKGCGASVAPEQDCKTKSKTAA
jgi:hypothetical protein